MEEEEKEEGKETEPVEEKPVKHMKTLDGGECDLVCRAIERGKNVGETPPPKWDLGLGVDI